MNAHRNDKLRTQERLRASRPDSRARDSTLPRRILRTVVCFLTVAVLGGCAPAEVHGQEEVTTCRELEYAERMQCLKEILAADPCSEEAFIELTWSAGKHGDWQGLLDVLEELSQLAPEKPHFEQLRGLIYRDRLNDDARAQECFRAVENLEPCLDFRRDLVANEPIQPTRENADRILERGMTKYIQLRDYAGAVEDFETYLSLVDRPINPNVFRQLSGARRQLGDLPGAIDALSLQIEVFPETTMSALSTRAELRRELGDEVGSKHDLAELERLTLEHNQRAISKLNERIASRPESAWLYIERGKLRMKAGDYEGAIGDANRAMELAPEFAAAFELRAKAKTELGDLKGARADREYSYKLLRDEKDRR